MQKSTNWQFFKDYLHFWWQSGNAHALHSPFMYNLATKCFYDKTKYADYQLLKNYQKALAKNNTIINIDDLGAGSRKLTGKQRKISNIAKIAGSNYDEMKRLYRLSNYFKPNHILELGTSLGKSAVSLALGNPSANVITVEGDKSISQVAQKNIKQFDIENIQIINQDFDYFLTGLNKTNQLFDMIILDGNHRYKPTIEYFEKLIKHMHNDTVVIVDDIYWSDEMKNAWQALKNHQKVRQSINTYHFGMLFFRKEQFQENFVIRL
jgi:predicted O-methyltransferase YrrM